MKKKRFSRKAAERQREERLGGDTSPYLGAGVSDVWETKEEGREQGCSRYYWERPLGVGMSVPAHPQAIERLGNRGWLKPPPPEDCIRPGWDPLYLEFFL